jgi:chemotaxis regulatin CheY-phosphate phosphatase CheZ
MSMNLRELDDVLQKIAELRVFFDFGQKTVPLLDDVVSFVNEIGPAIESMKALVRVASTKIPKASDQLVRVNQTSEQASNDILNTVDRMISVVEQMKSEDRGAGSSEEVFQTADLVAQSVNLLVDKSGWDDDVRQLLSNWELHFQSLKTGKPSMDIRSKLEDLSKDCTDVMMALQVQDITGQQIAMVIGTMQALGDVLHDLSQHFAFVAEVTSPAPENSVASLSENVGADERKKLVESLLLKARSGELLQR